METYIRDAEQRAYLELAELLRKAKKESGEGAEQGKARLAALWRDPSRSHSGPVIGSLHRRGRVPAPAGADRRPGGIRQGLKPCGQGIARRGHRHRRCGDSVVLPGPDRARERYCSGRSSSGIPVGSAPAWSCYCLVGRWWCRITPAAFCPVDPRASAVDLHDMFGYDWLIYSLTRRRPVPRPCCSTALPRLGAIDANRDNAATALRAGAVVMVFPGGDDAGLIWPTLSEKRHRLRGPHRICPDGDRRRGTDRACGVHRRAGEPVLPVSRYLAGAGTSSRQLRAQVFPDNILPIAFGFPFGLSILLPINMPLPTKIVTQVLKPIDIDAQFGEHPDVDEIDAHVRRVMQTGLDERPPNAASRSSADYCSPSSDSPIPGRSCQGDRVVGRPSSRASSAPVLWAGAVEAEHDLGER